MVVERYTHGAAPVYQRAAERGRLLPAGLTYVDSWIDERLDRCFQLMETDDPRLLDEWISLWSDIVDFEVVPVIGSADAAARVLGTAER
jgi:Protein of unknown function (DUF3303)